MEKAILKTLNYADIFDYPLKAYEIHKWLIGRKANLRQVESVLGRLVQSSKCKVQNGYYYLPKRVDLVGKRKRKEKQSGYYFKKTKLLTSLLKLIPWVKLVGISGGLSMDNASKLDDIDLFIVTSKNRLWLSRILTLGLLSLTGQRRKVGENGRKIAGKLCINMLLEEDRLALVDKDIYLAHEVLQMKVLWERDGMYQKYLEDNEWVFKYIPNWTISSLRAPKGRGNLLRNGKIASSLPLLAMTVERLAKWIQLKIMKQPLGMERIEDGGLYFHPDDCRPKVLNEFKRRILKLNSGTP